jgi:tetratricopeptide (TPR) repeat protein
MNAPVYSDRKFFGRKSELVELSDWLNGTDQKWVTVLLGPGGIGKSQLIEHFAENNQGKADSLVARYPIDLYWTAHQVEVGILRSMTSQLGGEATFRNFYQLLNDSQSFKRSVEQFREAFLDDYLLLGKKRVLLLFDTLESASDSAIRLFTKIAPRLRAVNENTRMLIAGRPKPAILPSLREIKNDIKYIELKGLSKEDFSEYINDATSREIPEEVVENVYKLTVGRPMWAGLLADWVNDGNSPATINTESFQEFKRNVLTPVERFHIPENMAILAMAHLNRRCNEQIFSKVLVKSSIDIADIVEKISKLSFVKYRKPVGEEPTSCLLHDEMRDLVKELLWESIDRDGPYRKNWSEKVIDYYDEEIDKIKGNSQVDLIDRHNLCAERLYYLFQVNPSLAFDNYIALFSRAASTDIREQLNSEVDSAREEFKFKLAETERHRYLLAQGLVEHQRERYKKAIEILTQLSNDVNCEISLLTMARSNLISSYTLVGDIQKAVDSGEEWKSWLNPLIQNLSSDNESKPSLIKNLGALYSQLGQAYRKNGMTDQALMYYKKGLEQFEQSGNLASGEIASTKINLAFVFHELGRSSEALAQCRGALWINEKLGDPYHLGRAHNVLGIIYDGVLREDDARGHFEKALWCFEEAKNKRGQSMTRIAYGRMLRQKQLYNEKRDPLNIKYAEPIYTQAAEMFDKAINDLREIESDPALLAVGLNEKATLLRQQNQLDQALETFKESSDIAAKIHNSHRIADNLQDIAIVYYLMGNLDLAFETANNAIKLAKGVYPHVSGRAKRTIACVLYDQMKYDSAFDIIGDSCVEIAKVDPESFTDSVTRKERLLEEWLDWIKELLDNLPTVEMKNEKIKLLMHCWGKGEIDGKSLSDLYPDFIDTLKALLLVM